MSASSARSRLHCHRVLPLPCADLSPSVSVFTDASLVTSQLLEVLGLLWSWNYPWVEYCVLARLELIIVILIPLKLLTWDQISIFFFFLLVLLYLFTAPVDSVLGIKPDNGAKSGKKTEPQVHSDKNTTELPDTHHLPLLWLPRVYKALRVWSFEDLVSRRL